MEEEKEVKEEVEQPVEQEVNLEKPNNKIYIVVIAVLAIICGILVFMLFNLNNKKEVEKPSEQQNSNPAEVVSVSASGEAQNNNEKTFKTNVTDFDLFFLKENNKEENTVYSPMVMKNVLSMIKDGASGETKAQIEKVLGNYEPKKYANNEHISTANALYVRDTFRNSVKDSYIKLLTDKYLAEVNTDPFTSSDNINKWVSNKTGNLIKDLLDDNYLSDKDFVLINTLAINMDWTNQIHCVSGTQDKYPCLVDFKTNVEYPHERLEGDSFHFTQSSFPYLGSESGSVSDVHYDKIKFDEAKEVNASSIVASYNRYDIIKELGEDRIREVAHNWYTEGEGKCRKCEYVDGEHTCNDCTYTDEELNGYIDEVVKELSENYGKEYRSSDYLLYTDDKVKSFAKDLKEYNGVKLMYVGIMPKNGRLNSYINNVTQYEVNSIVRNLKSLKIENFKDGYATVIEGYIPFFKYDYKADFTESIKKLGIVDMFDSTKANLSEMVDASGSRITDVLQKSTIEFSNFGISAAAAGYSGGAGDTIGPELLFEIPTERINLTFDKPYMYLILDKDTGEVWFTGTVYNPIENY